MAGQPPFGSGPFLIALRSPHHVSLETASLLHLWLPISGATVPEMPSECASSFYDSGVFTNLWQPIANLS